MFSQFAVNINDFHYLRTELMEELLDLLNMVSSQQVKRLDRQTELHYIYLRHAIRKVVKYIQHTDKLRELKEINELVQELIFDYDFCLVNEPQASGVAFIDYAKDIVDLDTH